MKKYSVAIIVILLTGIVSWLIIPGVFIYIIPSCQMKTVFITEEPGNTIVAKGSWIIDTVMGKGIGSYSGHIGYYDPDGRVLRPEKRVHISFITEFKTVGWAVQMTTIESQLNMGNTATMEEAAHYVYPALRAGYSSLNYLFNINERFLASGLDNDPRAVCIPQD